MLDHSYESLFEESLFLILISVECVELPLILTYSTNMLNQLLLTLTVYNEHTVESSGLQCWD